MLVGRRHGGAITEKPYDTNLVRYDRLKRHSDLGKLDSSLKRRKLTAISSFSVL